MNVRLYKDPRRQLIELRRADAVKRHGKSLLKDENLPVILAHDKELSIEAQDAHHNLINLPKSSEVE